MDEEHVPPERMRASDSDRDSTAARLAAALTEGRLDLDEYQRRLDLTMRAVVRGDLTPITADLPEPVLVAQEQKGDTERSRDVSSLVSPWKDWVDEWRWWLGGAIIMTGIWTVTSVMAGDPLTFWPLVPLGIWAAILVAAAVWPDESSGTRN
ncbi:uncharacterized protein DUF1707 [Murinocardiopsis flavida]|uniref:Uncharacterized protein DUF1707 n=1 Tax=Murinocardiopsis flavida TaxID=645275 RepID=A0A2P8DTV9_9ACTN|nr:DUF1707 domain-containing protein [Murinocardiopsis flavida]PSL00651.1 uncharacterized protein DUF1707 [Murinocardiopsis flavida]